LFRVDFSNNSEKFLKNCDAKTKERLKELFEILAQNPLPAMDYDFRKIAGEDEIYRIRLSSYRVIYKIYWEEKTIFVIKVEMRKESTYKF
jgi:mRNA interferase RelE/StbE